MATLLKRNLFRKRLDRTFQPLLIKKFLSTNQPQNDFSPISPINIKNSFKKHLDEAREKALVGGGQTRIKTQHQRGKLTGNNNQVLVNNLQYLFTIIILNFVFDTFSNEITN